MAAILFWSESNGAGQVVTDNISNINFGSADVPNLTPAQYPLVIPSSDVTQTPASSYTKFLRVKVSSMGGSNNITNLKVYKSAGAYKTGESILSNSDASGGGGAGRWLRVTYHTPFSWRTNANQPAYLPLFIGITLPTTANIGIDLNGVADDGSVDTVSGTITTAPTYTLYQVLVALIASTASPGAVFQKTFSWLWDES